MAVEKRLAYAAVLPVLLLSFRILPSDSPNSVGGGGRAQTLDPPASKYVVRFVEYRHAEEHREYLEAGLRGAAPPAESWWWIERRNPAAAFPTDFAVLEIRDAHRDAVVAAVLALGRVRDVHADATYSRGVLSADQPPLWRGKLFTAMSFEDGGEKEVACSPRGNLSFATFRRKLLGQGPQVTSLLEAQRLWCRGFTGSKVKMAIFDTGIRADHPHFRNIKVDIEMLTASQWMVPCFVATACLMLYICRVQQKRRRRRKGSVANRLTSMV